MDKIEWGRRDDIALPRDDVEDTTSETWADWHYLLESRLEGLQLFESRDIAAVDQGSKRIRQFGLDTTLQAPMDLVEEALALESAAYR